MKQLFTVPLIFFLTLPVAAQSLFNPNKQQLTWFLLGVVSTVLFLLFAKWFINCWNRLFSFRGKRFGGVKVQKGTEKSVINRFKSFQKEFFRRNRVSVKLEKNRLYYPEFLKLIVYNRGKHDVDIDTPLLIFSSIWVSRKFKLKGLGSSFAYPLYLSGGQTHTLVVDLDRFYRFDRYLKRLPRVRVVVYTTGGRRLGSCKLLLRKTLFNI